MPPHIQCIHPGSWTNWLGCHTWPRHPSLLLLYWAVQTLKAGRKEHSSWVFFAIQHPSTPPRGGGGERLQNDLNPGFPKRKKKGSGCSSHPFWLRGGSCPICFSVFLLLLFAWVTHLCTKEQEMGASGDERQNEKEHHKSASKLVIKNGKWHLKQPVQGGHLTWLVQTKMNHFGTLSTLQRSIY